LALVVFEPKPAVVRSEGATRFVRVGISRHAVPDVP
jgi:hypothetical protein